MHKHLNKTVLLLLFCFINTMLFANDFKVSTIAEFDNILQKVQPGDNIIWLNGTYKDIKINFMPSAKGTVNKVITLKAETPGAIIFQGASQIFLSGNYLQVEGFLFKGVSGLTNGKDVFTFKGMRSNQPSAIHCRVTNCAVVDYNPIGNDINYNWVSLSGQYNQLDHCYFKGKIHQGPYLVVAYDKPANFVEGSDACASTYHHIHHNYFGYRDLPTDNGGECMRIGDSKTSFTKGFNIIESNYFEEERNEPEVISNKSCNNIYRYNSFFSNDGALVLRHGNGCLVYNNYINGRSGRGFSGGLRVIGENHTLFANYLENQEGAKSALKAPITIMNGMKDGPVNGYFAAHNAVVCYNTVVNAKGPVVAIGVKNKNREMPVTPDSVVFAYNAILKAGGEAFSEAEKVKLNICTGNVFDEGSNSSPCFSKINKSQLTIKDNISQVSYKNDAKIIAIIQQRLKPFQLTLSTNDITTFDIHKIITKKDAGTSWMIK